MNLLIIRLIIFAVLFYAGLKLYGRYRQWKMDQEALDKPQQKDKVQNASMVRCRWCDVHVPEDEALRHDQQWFCSSAHRDRFIQEQHDDNQAS